MFVALRTALLAACISPAFSQAPPPLVNILGEELERNFRVLKEKGDPAPYYISYEVTEREGAVVSAAFGALKSSRTEHVRQLDVTIRVGSPKLDNYHRVRGERAQFTAGVPLPLDDGPAAIRRIAWLETDRVYRLAAERLMKIRTNRDVSVAEEDDSDDFSKEEPATSFDAPPPFSFPLEAAAARVRKLSLAFTKYPTVLTSQVVLSGQRETRSFLSTEGARIQYGRNSANLGFVARSKAADGMDVAVSDSFDAQTAAGLAGDDEVLKSIERIAMLAVNLPRGPVVEPYVGPAILSGRASAVLFHEIFGHRIEGHRQKDESEGQTFTKMVGTSVLPDFLSVVFDPTRAKTQGISLNGWYAFDDEGVKAQPVTVVDHGVLKTFLMSRSPVRGFDHSNGHGRRQPGHEVVSRQSNLFVEPSKTVSEAKLREMLLAEVRRQNKPYGLYFDQVTGGFTTTGRQGLQAFKVIPLVVYRVYADGRKDELVRGADIVGTPLASFAKILAAGDRPQVFNGFCGAESGSVPVAAVSPALLISEIEIQKKAKSDDRPPLLPSPLQGGPQ
ncbi:MAG TPA: metallopeptidase TldD-related protein [Bryobacteraceae bacterium]|nr:metallopeptidase TldD-related protein [Bryobacteraceae bacterium]